MPRMPTGKGLDENEDATDGAEEQDREKWLAGFTSVIEAMPVKNPTWCLARSLLRRVCGMLHGPADPDNARRMSRAANALVHVRQDSELAQLARIVETARKAGEDTTMLQNLLGAFGFRAPKMKKPWRPTTTVVVHILVANGEKCDLTVMRSRVGKAMADAGIPRAERKRPKER